MQHRDCSSGASGDLKRGHNMEKKPSSPPYSEASPLPLSPTHCGCLGKTTLQRCSCPLHIDCARRWAHLEHRQWQLLPVPAPGHCNGSHLLTTTAATGPISLSPCAAQPEQSRADLKLPPTWDGGESSSIWGRRGWDGCTSEPRGEAGMLTSFVNF